MLSTNAIRSLLLLNEDTLLLGTFGGLNMLSLSANIISPLNMNLKKQGGLNHYSVHSMLLDDEQTLWVGTYSAGINYYSPYFKPVSVISSAIFTGIIGKGGEDRDGNMWFATEGAGLLFYNPQTKEQKVYPLKPLAEENYETNIFKYIAIKGDSVLCSTHFGSVYVFSIKSGKYTLLYDFGGNDINSLFIDHKERLWIPTFNKQGLVMVGKNGEMTSQFELADNKRIGFNRITCIQEIAPDRFLFGSLKDSIYLYDMRRKTAENITARIKLLQPQERLGGITSIVRDSACIWISTTKGGLVRFDEELTFQKRYAKEDGLPDSYLTSVVLDEKKDVWVVSGKDIFRLNKMEDRFYSMNLKEVISPEFTLFAGTASSGNTVYFPANNGVLAFNPEELSKNPLVPSVRITKIITSDQKEILPDGVKKQAGNTYSVKLQAGQNSFSIKYVALNYINPGANQYKYMMDGIDDRSK